MIRIKLSTLLWIINTLSLMGVFCSLFEFSPVGLLVSLAFTAIFGLLTYFAYGRNIRIVLIYFAISAVIALLMAAIGVGDEVGLYIAWCIISFAIPFGISLFSKRYLLGGICGGICLVSVFLTSYLSPVVFVITVVTEIIIMIVKSKKEKG